MNSYQFKFKGTTYECCGEDKDFQIWNFNFCIKQKDWQTISNRIVNQLMWFPKDLKKIIDGKFISTIKPSRTESIDSDIIVNQNGTKKKTFW